MDQPDITPAGRLTVFELFAAQAARSPNALALTQGDASWSYGELEDRVRRVAAVLSSRGLAAGDRIALLSENRHEYVEIELAAALLGAIVACQNWRLAPDELRHCIDLVEPKLVIASPRHVSLLENLGRTTDLVIGPDLESALTEAAPLTQAPAVDPESGLVIL